MWRQSLDKPQHLQNNDCRDLLAWRSKWGKGGTERLTETESKSWEGTWQLSLDQLLSARAGREPREQMPRPLPLCESESKVTQFCPTLCHPMDSNLPGSSIRGISQARILEWIAISFSRGSYWPRDWTPVSCIAGRLFYCLSHQGIPLCTDVLLVFPIGQQILISFLEWV